MIPRERALVPVRRRSSHWVPISEQGGGAPPSGFLKRLAPTLRMAAPMFAKWLGFSKEVQMRLFMESMPDLMDLVDPETFDDEPTD